MVEFLDFTKQVFSGKTISRVLFNWQVKKNCAGLSGVCIDFAGGKKPSYEKYWNLKCDKLIKTDIEIDLNKSLPFGDNFADNAFLFNALYILEKPEESVKEIHRILKPGGNFFLSVPFIANEMPEPRDYCRFTAEKLERILSAAGFKNIKITRCGERFSACVYLLHNFFLFNFVRFFVFILALGLDNVIPKKMKKLHPCPIGYFVKAIK